MKWLERFGPPNPDIESPCNHSSCQTMRTILFLCLVLPAMSWAKTPEPHRKLPRLLFVFGDSHTDTGNSPNYTQAWQFPYGITWPGHPAGRLNDGYSLTDTVAKALGVPLPIPYRKLPPNSRIAAGGINFAEGGAGATYAFGIPKFSTQVEWLAELIELGHFSERLGRPVVVVSVSGNDYGAYNGSTLEGYFRLAEEVPRLIDASIRTLYSLGLRNFMVTSMNALTCIPFATEQFQFQKCEKNGTIEAVIATHDKNLGSRLRNLTVELKGSSALYLSQTEAIMRVVADPEAYGFREGLRPCCPGTCAFCDEDGTPLFTLCSDPSEHFFWDQAHPTHAAWAAMVKLFARDHRFARSFGVHSIRDWLKFA